MASRDLDHALENPVTREALEQLEDGWAIDRQPSKDDVILYFRDDAVQVQSELTLREYKFVFYLLAMIDPANPVMHRNFRFDVRRFAELSGLDVHALWKELKDLTKSLTKKQLTVKGIIFPDQQYQPYLPGGYRYIFNWISCAAYYDERRYLVVTLTPEIVDLWNKWLFKKLSPPHWFTIPCAHFFKLRSIYSARLYTYLSGRRDQAITKVSTSQLREILLPPQDQNAPKTLLPLNHYKDLKKRAIEPAVTEINTRTDLEVTYEEFNCPGSKAIGQLVFTVQKKSISGKSINGNIHKPGHPKVAPPTRLALPDKQPVTPVQQRLQFETSPDHRQIVARIRDQWGLTARQLEDLENALLEKGPEFVLSWEKHAQDNGKNPVGLFCDAMRARRPITNGHQITTKIQRSEIDWDWKAFLVRSGMTPGNVPKSLEEMSDRMFKHYIVPEHRKRSPEPLNDIVQSNLRNK